MSGLVKDLYSSLLANSSILPLAIVFLFVFFITTIAIRIFNHKRSPLLQIPGVECPSWIFGQMLWFIEDQKEKPFARFEEWQEKFGGVTRHHFFFGEPRVTVTDPDALKYVHVTNQQNYVKAEVFGSTQTEILLGRQGSVFSHDPLHKQHRKLLNPIFKVANLKRMIPMLEDKAGQLVKFWQLHYPTPTAEFKDITVEEDVRRMTLEAIGQAAFGYNFNCIAAESEMSKVWSDLLKLSVDTDPISALLRFVPYYEYIPTAPNLRFWRLLNKLHRLVEQMITEKKEMLQKDRSKASEDLLGMMLLAEDPQTHQKLSFSEVRDEAKTFLAAGHETTSLGLSWALYELSFRPEIQAKCREEIEAILPRENVTWEDLDKMKYLTCVAKEALRMHAPAPAGLRKALKDDYIGGYLVPKGTIVLCLQGVTHLASAYWTDPLKFDPDRFADESQIRPFAYLPFIAGNRMCIGYKFAMAEMVLCLAKLLREFEFAPHPTIKYATRMVITQCPFPALRLLMRPVQQRPKGLVVEGH